MLAHTMTQCIPQDATRTFDDSEKSSARKQTQVGAYFDPGVDERIAAGLGYG